MHERRGNVFCVIEGAKDSVISMSGEILFIVSVVITIENEPVNTYSLIDLKIEQNIN